MSLWLNPQCHIDSAFIVVERHQKIVNCEKNCTTLKKKMQSFHQLFFFVCKTSSTDFKKHLPSDWWNCQTLPGARTSEQFPTSLGCTWKQCESPNGGEKQKKNTERGVLLTIGPTSPFSPFSPGGPGKPWEEDKHYSKRKKKVHVMQHLREQNFTCAKYTNTQEHKYISAAH